MRPSCTPPRIPTRASRPSAVSSSLFVHRDRTSSSVLTSTTSPSRRRPPSHRVDASVTDRAFQTRTHRTRNFSSFTARARPRDRARRRGARDVVVVVPTARARVVVVVAIVDAARRSMPPPMRGVCVHHIPLYEVYIRHTARIKDVSIAICRRARTRRRSTSFRIFAVRCVCIHTCRSYWTHIYPIHVHHRACRRVGVDADDAGRRRRRRARGRASARGRRRAIEPSRARRPRARRSGDAGRDRAKRRTLTERTRGDHDPRRGIASAIPGIPGRGAG